MKFFLRKSNRKGQAITEVVLMLPLLFIFMLFMVRIFFLLVLVQKMEIAAFYAARRYQLQSHRSVTYQGYNDNLEFRISEYVREYLGVGSYPGLSSVDVEFTQSQVWCQIDINAHITVLSGALQTMLCRGGENTVCSHYDSVTCGRGYDTMCGNGAILNTTKYVAPRDRYLEFSLPGLSN
ncbi:MAG: pilus assembly protein [Elusimicrobiaceae bacterium]|nr:pilus assembly protein [Elusimicrobiaceae bacterium]